MHLKGPAKQWFNDVVPPAPPYVEKVEDIIEQLLHNFIHIGSTFQADKEFNELRYSSPKGINGLYLDLERVARKMPIPPTELRKVTKFLGLILEPIRRHIMEGRDFTPYMSLKALSEEAIIFERNRAFAQTFGDQGLGSGVRDNRR
jgi:hypothetical protein